MIFHKKFIKSFFIFIVIVFSSQIINGGNSTAHASGPINVWWPTTDAHVQGVQPFKASVDGLDISSYDLYWQVDGGTLNVMENSSTDSPHKEMLVDVSSWNWHSTGPYVINYVAKQNGNSISQTSVPIYVDNTNVTTSVATPPVSIVPPPPAILTIWWPMANTTLSGVQPLKAALQNTDVNSYVMYWQVEGGTENSMPTIMTEGPHKEVSVDTSLWQWQPSHTYTLTFTAKSLSGQVLAKASELVTNTPPTQPISRTIPPTVSVPPSSSSLPFYVNTNSSAAQQAIAWKSSRPNDAAAMRLLASAPTATWFGGWSGDIHQAVTDNITPAVAAGKMPILVAYDIPQRDCGGYSAGGSSDYLRWITSFANGIGNNPALVILEPDSIAQSGCLSKSDQTNRFSLLSKAVSILKSNPRTMVYLDGGHANWIDAQTMTQRLEQANISSADGFSLNVSNFDSTTNETTYGQLLSTALHNKHFVIDTSRNGNGFTGEWCNPSGRAIGAFPTIQTGIQNLDAYVWIKTPGESDGTCNSGPSAGTWWPEYALGLVTNKH